MKVAIVSKNNTPSSLNSILKKAGIKIVKKNPDMVVTHGGDGTFLVSERLYPKVPKAVIKYGKSKICFMCGFETPKDLIKALQDKKYEIIHIKKLETKSKGKKLKGVNDIIIRNKNQTEAIRFSIHINKELLYHEIIGDGIIAATPLGSTAYFNSVTRESFKDGIGLAFNNIYGSGIKPLYLKDTDVIKFKLLVGEAYVSADNNKDMILLKKGDSTKIRVSKETASLIK